MPHEDELGPGHPQLHEEERDVLVDGHPPTRQDVDDLHLAARAHERVARGEVTVAQPEIQVGIEVGSRLGEAPSQARRSGVTVLEEARVGAGHVGSLVPRRPARVLRPPQLMECSEPSTQPEHRVRQVPFRPPGTEPTRGHEARSQRRVGHPADDQSTLLGDMSERTNRAQARVTTTPEGFPGGHQSPPLELVLLGLVVWADPEPGAVGKFAVARRHRLHDHVPRRLSRVAALDSQRRQRRAHSACIVFGNDLKTPTTELREPCWRTLSDQIENCRGRMVVHESRRSIPDSAGLS